MQKACALYIDKRPEFDIKRLSPTLTRVVGRACRDLGVGDVLYAAYEADGRTDYAPFKIKTIFGGSEENPDFIQGAIYLQGCWFELEGEQQELLQKGMSLYMESPRISKDSL